MKIVVDCANGATYHIAPHVLDELGADVVSVGCQPNGLNINDGVGSTKPGLLQKTVLEQGADLGIALDGDGDRLIMVDSRGRLIDGDGIIYVIARSRKQTSCLAGPVVGTVMSNLGLEHALAAQGIAFERTQVGDRYIMERLKESGGMLGGEPSGHVICRDRTTTGDGIVTALQVIAEMVKGGFAIEDLVADLSVYPQVLVNVELPAKVDVLAQPRVVAAIESAENELNGNGRILLRPSGTEPLIRVMVEGREEAQVKSIAQRLADTVKESVETLM
jgi:phosphoglucosamine mutase